MTLRAVIYSRVSTDAQERDGTSLDTQERACREHVRAHGWRLAESVRDAASGYTLDRPGIERVRHLLRDGAADAVVAYAVDRLSRNQNHIGVLFDEAHNAGAQLEFVTEKFEDTAVGRFILAARAFAAEVEREKTAERTMRGKAERARSGRLPQGTGKGFYGYRYDPPTGRREVIPEQAEVVVRIFSEFVRATSIIRIANGLNQDRIPAFVGGPWYPATVYRVLRNEAYTGRTVFRRTVARDVRDPRTGRKHRKVECRDPREWIDITGATPLIIEPSTFATAQALLDDPERRRRGRRLHEYPMSGHMRCSQCGKAMVGQTLQKQFRYYRCRRSFAGPKHDRCPTRYVRADDLERAIREEVARVLTDPRLVAEEYQRWRSASDTRQDRSQLKRQLARLDDEKRRLVKLYQLGEIDDEYLEAESRKLRLRRKPLEDQLEQQDTTALEPSWADLPQACERIRRWVEESDGDDLQLMMDALQIQILAETGRAELLGVIPDVGHYAPPCSDADVRPVVAMDVRNKSQDGKQRRNCLFCDIVRGDAKSYRVLEDSAAIAVLDHRPLLEGHCLLVPRDHHETLLDMPPRLVEPIFRDVQLLAMAVQEALAADGSFVAINTRVSQSVPHVHVHVVP